MAEENIKNKLYDMIAFQNIHWFMNNFKEVIGEKHDSIDVIKRESNILIVYTPFSIYRSFLFDKLIKNDFNIYYDDNVISLRDFLEIISRFMNMFIVINGLDLKILDPILNSNFLETIVCGGEFINLAGARSIFNGALVFINPLKNKNIDKLESISSVIRVE